MADAASIEEEDEMKKAMEETELLLGRVSARLQQVPGAARVATDEYRLRSLLMVMEMELSAILAQLRREQTLKKSPRRNRMTGEELLDLLRATLDFFGDKLDEYEQHTPRHVLHRAARCLRCTTTAGLSGWNNEWEIECPLRLAEFTTIDECYEHLLLVGDDGDDTAASSSSRIYSELPSELKLSLLYMVSMFPQGYIFDKHRLTWRWTSEGLPSCLIRRWKSEGLTGRHNMIFEEISADNDFLELVDSEVITRAANYGEKPAAEDWQVNPDMLQFLATESANKGIVYTSGMLDSPAATGDNASTDLLRWLSLHQPDPWLPTLLETKDLSQTRSLAVSGKVEGIPLDKFIYLRVLDLEGWENLKDEDLPLICSKMLLLCYLGVRNTGVTRLPPEIKELHILNVLDVSHTSLRELPSEVCELKLFTALDLRSTQIRQLPEQIAERKYLQHLLIGGDGINPDEIAAKIPEGIVRARYLRTLATADLSECSASYVEALGCLRDLEVLAITWSFHQCTDVTYQDALRSSIGKWSQLKSLTIHCGLGCSMEFLGSQLSHRPQKLETFKVTTGRFFVVPKWIQGLGLLSFLQITVCKLGTDDLKILGELPKLQCLVVGLDFLPEEAIVIPSESFGRLRTFSVDCLVLVPWLIFTRGAMRRLTYLDLEICSSVSTNQEIVLTGISNLEKLAEVVLRYNKMYSNSSSVKMTVEAVKKAVVNHHNRINLVINGIQHVDEETVRRTTTQIQSEIESIEESLEETLAHLRMYGITCEDQMP